MRCKKHLTDLSSTIGVCASCLREKLFFLIEAQSQTKSVPDFQNPNPNYSNHNHSQHNRHRNLQNQPQPLIFPRSVSPYISRRKSDLASNSKTILQRFYSTPQVGPTFDQHKKKITGKLSLIKKIFRSKSSVSSTANSEVSPADLTRWRNRGMSPENEWDDELEESINDSPMTKIRPSPGRVRPSPARLANNVANFAFCLSPLVRASPASRYNRGGGEPSFSGEIRVSATGKSSSCHEKKPHLSEAASFCANRSRKLADFGRINRNR
ncbi:unnamed protein product [Amaranthus hypochondriacus]